MPKIKVENGFCIRCDECKQAEVKDAHSSN